MKKNYVYKLTFDLLISHKAISYIIVSFSMYIVSQITPLEWRKSTVLSHDKESVCGENEMCGSDDDKDLKDDDTDSCFHDFCETSSKISDICKADIEFYLQEEYLAFIAEKENLFSVHPENSVMNNNKCQCSSSKSHFVDGDESIQDIELISYENNFNLQNSFWWSMATLIQQTTSDLYPKVL